METSTSPSPSPSPSPEIAKATLSIADLQMVINIIETCSKRGAFKPHEFEPVGKLFNHLSLFVKQHIPLDESNSNSETEEVVDSSTDESQVNSVNNKTL